MDSWFENTAVGAYVAAQEKGFFEQNANGRADAKSVQIGLKCLRPSERVVCVPGDVRMDAVALAWESRSLDELLLPHAHEYCRSPLLALAEAARVLKPEGRLVLTGFNPYSLWGMSTWFDGRRLPCRAHCFALPEFKRQLQTLGFEIEYGKFMVYVPPVDSEKSLAFWRFLDKAGDRWWPQCAAVYGLVLVKRVAGIRPLPEWEALLQEDAVVLGAARLRTNERLPAAEYTAGPPAER